MTAQPTLWDAPEIAAPRTGVRPAPARPQARRTPSPVARTTDPATSHEAARRVAPRAKNDRERVLHLLMAHPEGLTDFELAARLDGRQTSLGVRRKELVDLGLVEWAGFTRDAPSGSPARVWRVVRGAR